MPTINDEKLSQLFNIAESTTDTEIVEYVDHVEQIEPPVDLPDESEFDSELEYDIAVARQNILNVITVSKNVVESAATVAADSEHPKSIEAYAALIKSISDASERLINIHTQKKAILKSDKKEDTPSGNVTNNTVAFVGTPAELMKMINGNKE